MISAESLILLFEPQIQTSIDLGNKFLFILRRQILIYMRYSGFFVVLLSVLFLFSCDSRPTDKKTGAALPDTAKNDVIPYTLAKNYFVKNTFTGVLSNPKISTEAEFNTIFGMATTMGADGKPTSIDFSSQYVIAVIAPKTDTAKTLIAEKLVKDGTAMVLNYSISTGQKQSFVSQPFLLLVVNNEYTGDVKTNQQPVR